MDVKIKVDRKKNRREKMLLKKRKKIIALAMLVLMGMTPMKTSAAGNGTVNIGVKTSDVTTGSPVETVDMSLIKAVTNDQNKTQAIVCAPDVTEVKNTPNEMSGNVLELKCTDTVYVDEVVASEDKVWIKVHLYTNSGKVEGYIPEKYLFYTDQGLAKEVENVRAREGIEEETPEFLQGLDGMRWDIAMFPASYRRKLLDLMKIHPNWSFLPLEVDLDFNTVVYNETNPISRSLVHKSRPESWKRGSQPDGWGFATEEVVRHYLDPRNFLNEQDIFMFEQLTLLPGTCTIEGLQSYLDNTFMAGLIPTGEFKYANVFYQVGTDLGVSPYHLASRVHQEQGAGTSPLISGTYAGYEGYYNYFNVGASGSNTTQIINSGLAYAKSHGWNSPYWSIKGGAEMICGNYILKGQDTLYQQKFDVVRSNNRNPKFPNLYTHQYMQNIEAPASEAKKTYAIYKGANALTTGFIFKIPVYKNMPMIPQGKPISYSDVKQGDWYYDFVSYVNYNHIMVGKSATTFAPNDLVTRGEFVTILYNAIGKPKINYQPFFFDVPAGQYYSDAVMWAYQNGIVAGYGNGYFGTNDRITREQMMGMVHRLATIQHLDLLAYTSVLDRFTDKPGISSWAEQAMAWGFQMGIMLGKTDTTIAPKDYATRAESATIIAKFMRLAD